MVGGERLLKKNDAQVYPVPTKSESLVWALDTHTFQAPYVTLKCKWVHAHCPEVTDPGSAGYCNKRDIVSWLFGQGGGRAG